MNIKEAKEEIKNTVRCYLSKDEYGDYCIPVVNQRPAFIYGPPGIGKTAVVEQIAAELGINMLSYSMTHHTRQSAIGLPLISEREYGGEKYSVTEYTMSEIISSIYETIEKSGNAEGILFLDEINCVSETLSPIMLQFLQYKIFGKHRIPDGWVIVTAGNPPDYNDSVREYDIATWDRLQKFDVSPDYSVWKEYARYAKIHPAIVSYLDVKNTDFYSIETTVEGKQFVTARGWEDLSKMIYLYEKKNIPVNKLLIGRFVQSADIARSFHIYYDLYNKYKSDYQIGDILAGNADELVIQRAAEAQFDERITVISLLLDSIMENICSFSETEEVILKLLQILKKFKTDITKPMAVPYKCMQDSIKQQSANFNRKESSGTVSPEDKKKYMKLNSHLTECCSKIENVLDGEEAFSIVKKYYDEQVKAMKNKISITKNMLDNAFGFMETAFSSEHEILIFVTELAANPYSLKFVAKFGCESYYKYNKSLMFEERKLEIDKILNDFNMED